MVTCCIMFFFVFKSKIFVKYVLCVVSALLDIEPHIIFCVLNHYKTFQCMSHVYKLRSLSSTVVSY